MKSLVTVASHLLHDSSRMCCVSTTRDEKTLLARFKHEGLPFLTITLPDFGKAFDRSLDRGQLLRRDFPSWKFSGCLPAFLRGFIRLVFDESDGSLLPDPDIQAIRCVRQIVYLAHKTKLECRPDIIRETFDKYVNIDQEVRASKVVDVNLLSRFNKVATLLYSDLFYKIEQKVINYELIPRHGPGKTADRLSGNAKFKQLTWTDRLEEYFPMGEYAFPSQRHYFNALEDGSIVWLDEDQEIPVKVTSVPKTMKSPRIIAQEPTCMQYMQQALLREFVSEIEGMTHPCSRMIGFSNQSINRRLACESSIDGSLATLDLSDASDRVSLQHVYELFWFTPELYQAISACRSQKAVLPDGRVISLAKFASMGSALTFPLEAMVFLTIIISAISWARGEPPSRKIIADLEGSVHVYGDDIIVPVEYTSVVIYWLEAFGLKVNRHKSFWTGKFRESCGGDYYDGHDVTPIKIRTNVSPTITHNASSLASLVSFRNLIFHKGYFGTTDSIDGFLSTRMRFPKVLDTSPVLGRHTLDQSYDCSRMCSELQVPLVKGTRLTAKPPKSNLDGYAALQKFFLKEGDTPFEQKDHLERYGRPRSVGTKIGWNSPY